MTFICALADDSDLTIEYLSKGSEHVAIAYIGHDDADGSSYSLFTALSPAAGGDMEHVFNLQRANDDGITTLWNGYDTKSLIPLHRDRRLILDAICGATSMLVEECRPEFIFHTTYCDNMPPKALAKHWQIMRVFEGLGYEVRTPDEYHGHRLWHATLKKA